MDDGDDGGALTTLRGEHAARFFAAASHALASSLDYQTTLRTVARQAVPAIADCCMIYLLEEDGSVQRAAMAHRDPEWVEAIMRAHIRSGYHSAIAGPP